MQVAFKDGLTLVNPSLISRQ